MKSDDAMLFYIPLRGIGKARARVTRWGTYTPKKTSDFEKAIKVYMHKFMGKAKPRIGPLFLSVEFFFKRPKSAKKRVFHTVKPDLSNLIKCIEDAGNEILWEDDSQIVSLSLYKSYSEKDEIRIYFGAFG